MVFSTRQLGLTTGGRVNPSCPLFKNQALSPARRSSSSYWIAGLNFGSRGSMALRAKPRLVPAINGTVLAVPIFSQIQVMLSCVLLAATIFWTCIKIAKALQDFHGKE